MAPRRSPEERFDERYHVEPNTGCWLWTSTMDGVGYGRLQVKGMGFTGAHRYSYVRFIGSIPPGMFICHRCDTRACVNPDHLFVGTPRDNTDDMMAKGRYRHPRYTAKTHCKRGHDFSQVDWSLPKGRSKPTRKCRVCARQKARERYARLTAA